jgi:trans-2,3-dihydro-3-hydroxyanthranilate isomerase
MRWRFATLDVFTAKRFTGNPLAVVLDPQGLDTAGMQIIAREFNLSETVFVMPSQAAQRRRVRIFTPKAEIPFAGHPTIGTAVLLGALGSSQHREVILEEAIGDVRCSVESLDAERGRARFDLPQLPNETRPAADAAALAAALGIDVSEIGFDNFVPGCWSAGNELTFVPVRSLSAIAKCRIAPEHWHAIDRGRPAGAYVFCRETVEPGRSFHARMFAPGLGVPEDPATGSAAAAFAGLLASSEAPRDGEHKFLLEQGYEMGRPSLIELSLSMEAGKLGSAAVGGEAVLVSEGTLEA